MSKAIVVVTLMWGCGGHDVGGDASHDGGPDPSDGAIGDGATSDGPISGIDAANAPDAELGVGTFFDDSFESCSVGTGNDFPCEGWNDFGQEDVDFLRVTTAESFSGSKSVRLTFNDVDGSSQMPSIYKNLAERQTHYFNRFAIQISPGFQIGSNLATKLVKVKDDVGYPDVWIMYRFGEYALVMEGPCGIPGTLALQGHVHPNYGSWDQLEFEWKLNTPGHANGELRLWVNGARKIQHLNGEYIGATPTSVNSFGDPCPSTWKIHTSQIFLQSGLGDIYYDRFAVGDQRIGPATP